MVFSRLPGCETLAYPELAQLENADIHYTTDAYETEIKGIAVTIAFGKVKREFDKPPYEAVYYPIYLVHKYNHSVIRKIGLIEYFKSDESHLDENLELNVVSAPFRPLIFPYITVDMLRKANMKSVEIVKQLGEEKAKKREKRMLDAAEDSDTGKGKGKGKGKNANANANAETPKKITMMASNVGAVTALSDLRPVVRVDSVDDVEDSEESGSGSDSASEKNPGPNVDASVIRDVTLPTQTKALADKERAEYVHSEETGRDVWIQQFMKNRHFGIEDNEGGTDSLFACIRDALLSQGNTTITIEQMRVKLASMATKELFQEYIKYYNKYMALLKQASEQLQEKKKQGNELSERIKGKHLSPTDMLKVKTEMTQNAAEQREKKTRVDFLKDIVMQKYGYMRQTESKFDNFKTILTTRAFIPDQWALRALERAYNISIIRMSEERFKDGDLDNVIVCGDRAADAPGLGISMVATRHPMREWEYTAYKPSIFIVVSVDQHNTYRLIRYRTKGSFSFVELPYDIRTHIVTKCIEDPETEFAFLPQFKRVLEIYPSSKSQSGGKSTDDDSETANRTRDVPVFQIYNRSGNDKPGHGAGEYVPAGMQHLFVPLSSHPHWRRSLTNMAESPFVLDRRTWFSVEHYYQGSKFKKHNHDFYLQFSMDSKSEISKNPELARAAGSDTGIFQGKLYRPKAVTIDRDFFSGGRGAEALSSAMEAKFRQHTDLRNILLGTLNARIYHFQRGERPILFKPLMQIRSKLESSI
jgi:predicted NAD-dependent protein-ADP-ribosyltransferase YbiA (DUF1768 family)